MDEKLKYIDNIVKDKLQGFQAKGASLGWAKVNKALSFKRFLRFSLAKFNVYYAAVIITGASTGAYIATEQFLNNKFSEGISIESFRRPQFNGVSKDTIVKPDSTQIKNITIDENNKIDNQIEKDIDSKIDKNQIDSSFKTKQAPIKEINRKKQVKVIRKQVLIRDTILKKDTVVVKKVIE